MSSRDESALIEDIALTSVQKVCIESVFRDELRREEGGCV